MNTDLSSDAEEYDYESYLEHEDFQEFIRDAARQFLAEASTEELAEIVFGDMDEAIEAFSEANDEGEA